MENLTQKQEEILKHIKEGIAKNGFPPTVRELCQLTGLSSTASIHVHLKNITDKGYIKTGGHKSRAIELLVKNEFASQNEDVVQVPLLGKVTAGSPIEAIERPDEYFSLPSFLIPNNKEVFTLDVSGDSMINAGILDGDIVIVQRQKNANNGDIIVAMTDDNEVTLKRFYKENNYIRLQPENDFLSPIILPNVTILGKAIGLYRKF